MKDEDEDQEMRNDEYILFCVLFLIFLIYLSIYLI